MTDDSTRYDMPSLRHLVILDPQWVIDAVTCFVRDFQLKDHSTEYARMKDLDQRAIREEPEAWELLTGGRATLQKKLLHRPEKPWVQAEAAEAAALWQRMATVN